MKITGQFSQLLKTALHIVALGLDLLYANTIRGMLGDPGRQAFAAGRADAVEVQAG
jgi:hypothetical protein